MATAAEIAGRLARVRQSMGGRAARALGNDIPRPRPAPLTPQQPAIVIPDRSPPPLLPPSKDIDAIIRKVEEQGLDSLTAQERLALESSQAPVIEPDVDEPVVAAVSPVETAQESRRIVFDGRTKSYVEEDADGNVIGKAVVIDKGEGLYRLDDGTVVDGAGTVVGRQSPGDLTDTSSGSPLDNTEQSGVELGGETPAASNLRPKKAKGTPPEVALKEAVWQATTPTDLESLAPATVRRLQKQVDSMSSTPEGRAKLIAAFGNKEEAERRLAALAAKHAEVTRDPNYEAAKRLDETAQERAASGKPRQASEVPLNDGVSRLPSGEAVDNAGRVVGTSWGEFVQRANLTELADQFNRLPEATRVQIAERLPADDPLRTLISAGGGTAFIDPNAVASAVRPVNSADEMITEMDAAMRRGDTEGAAAAKELAQGASDEERASAVAALRSRMRLTESLRGAVLPTRPPQSPLASVSPGQPSLRRPGATSPEIAGEVSGDQIQPPASRVAEVVEAERQANLDRRSAGGGLTRDEMLQAYGYDLDELNADPELMNEAVRSLPLWARGRDGRPTSFETRDRGDRLTNSSETRVGGTIDKGNRLEQEVRDALAEMSAANGAEELARARQRYEKATKALDKAYPPRVINQRTGQVRKSPPTKEELAGELPDGFIIERGRRPMPDSSLNRGGQQETYDDLLVAITGSRPRPEPNLNRASPDLSAADREAMTADAIRMMGDETPEDMLPEGRELDSTADVGGEGKPGRLGGRQQQSRIRSALRQLFGDSNPLRLNGSVFEGDPDAVAEQLLAGSTHFKPGTADYDMAREAIARAVRNEYDVPAPNTDIAPDAPVPNSSEPSRPVGTSQNAEDIPREGVRDYRGMPNGRPNVRVEPSARPAARDFSRPASEPLTAEERALLAEGNPNYADENLASSATDLGPAAPPVDAPTPPVATPVGAVPDPTATQAPTAAGDLAAAVDAVDDAPPQLPPDATPSQRMAAWGEWMARRRRAGKPLTAPAAPSSTAPAVGPATAPPKSPPPPTDPPGPPKPPSDDAGTSAADDLAPPVGEVGNSTARRRAAEAQRRRAEASPAAADEALATPARKLDDAEAAAKAADEADATVTNKTDDVQKKDAKSKWGLSKWLIGAGLLTGGGIALDRLGGGGGAGGGHIDIPGAGGGGPGGGEFYPIPTGSEGAVAADASEQDALTRALDRIRSARGGASGGGASYQTIQNYNMWR